MRQGIWRSSPALALAALALFVALGGSVYAAKKTKKPRINGKAIKAKSIPGNRLKPRSIPANRLKPGVLSRAAAQAGAAPLTGVDINELTLSQVPSAAHADSAGTAQSAVDAQTAVEAVRAVDAQTINGHSAGCLPGTQPFAGACWESAPHSPVNAPTAARKCAARGGELPDALQLAAFSEEPAVALSPGDEWSGDISVVSGLGVYAVATVDDAGAVEQDVSANTHAYRCVIPLVQ
jgi:hypothetical protein